MAQNKPDSTGLVIASGQALNGNPRWMAYKKGKIGRLSPKFGSYEKLVAWLRERAYI